MKWPRFCGLGAVIHALLVMAVGAVLNFAVRDKQYLSWLDLLINWGLPWRGSGCDCLALQNKIQKGQFTVVVVHVEFVIDQAKLDQFLLLMQDNARDSLALEPGCHQFDVTQDPRNPASIMLYELYDDAAAFDAHRAMPHYLAFIAAADSMIISKTVRQWQRIYP